jgi:hypothetical protein
MSKATYAKIVATKAATKIIADQEARHRLHDPFEKAKTKLQRHGYHVFSHSLLEPRSTLIVVGRRKMTRDELIALAASLQDRNTYPPAGE